MNWIEADQEWEVVLQHLAGERSSSKGPPFDQDEYQAGKIVIRAKVVVSGAGVLVEPNEWPKDVSGKDSFTGKVIHSARWPEDLDLDNKDVVVAGSGCSAAQIVPALLQTKIKSLTQVIRTPPWIVSRVEEPGSKETYAKWAPQIYGTLPLLGYSVRILICWTAELLWYSAFQRRNVRLRRYSEKAHLNHMYQLAPRKYHSIREPKYSLGCKRRVYDNEWLRSMSDPRFTLTHQPLLSAEGGTIKVGERQANATSLACSQTHPADIFILATGFQATQFLQPLSIIGRQGHSLHSLWAERGGAQAYMGTSLDNFPNFFMLMGPNTFVGHTSVMISIENSIKYILKMIRPVLVGDIVSLEPKSEATEKWTSDIRRDMKNTVFEGCQSWYNGNGAWNSVMYP